MDRTVLIRIILAMAGGVLWLSITLISGKNEAWDSELFWTFGLFGMLSMNAATGFMLPSTLLLNGLCSVALQPVVMMLLQQDVGALFPLGLCIFAMLGLFYAAGGWAGRAFRNWNNGQRRKGPHAP